MGRPDERNQPTVTIPVIHGIDLGELQKRSLGPPYTNSVTIEGIEVTQGVQNLNHDVPLIAGRKTIVRVYFDVQTSEGFGQISGRLLITSRLGPIFVDPAIQSISVLDQWNGNMSTFKRNFISTSLNFEIPEFLLHVDTFTIRVIQVIDMYRNRADVPITNGDTLTRTVNFVDGAPLRLTVIGLSYVQNSTTFTPRQLDFDLIQSWIQRAYPITSLTYRTRTVASTNTPPFTAQQANTQIAQIRALDLSGGTDRRTHYYGLVHDGGFFMRGLSNTPTSSPNPAAVGSGPTGAGTFGWDNDGSYGDWYTGHEVGHTLGRLHIGGSCSEPGPLDTAYPFPSGQLAGPTNDLIGLDVGDSRFNIPMQALQGTTWHDVMSYCNFQWVSSFTYQALLTRINAENALPRFRLDQSRANTIVRGSHLFVIGLWDKQQNSATVTSVDRVEQVWMGDLSDDLVVVALDANNQEVTSAKAVVYLPGCNYGTEPFLFTAAVPFNSAIQRLEVRKDKVVLGFHERKTTRAFERVPVAKLGEGILEWGGDTASVPDLHYHIQASNDGGYTWTTYAVGVRDKSFDVNSIRRDMLGCRFKVRVITTDGFNIEEQIFDFDEE